MMRQQPVGQHPLGGYINMLTSIADLMPPVWQANTVTSTRLKYMYQCHVFSHEIIPFCVYANTF